MGANMFKPATIKKGLHPFKAPAHTGGLVDFDEPFRTGDTAARKESQRQHEEMMKQAQDAQDMRKRQENVAQAEARLAEDQMFKPEEDALEIKSASVTDQQGGRRERKRQKAPSKSLGIK